MEDEKVTFKFNKHHALTEETLLRYRSNASTYIKNADTVRLNELTAWIARRREGLAREYLKEN